MNVKIISIQGKASHPKRISRLNTDCEFHSPLSVQTRQSNCSSRNKNGYHINFFNKDKAQRFFNFNSKANASHVQKRNRTPSKIGSQDSNKPMPVPLPLPVSIRITNVFDCKKKSKSKQSFLSPAKTDLSLRRKTTIQEKRTNFPLRNDDSRIDSKKHSKISSHLGMGNILYTTSTKAKVTPKSNNSVRREDAKDRERNESSIKKKQLSLLDNNDNALYANEIPDGIRKKMIVYYQAGSIDYRNDKPSEDKVGHKENSNKVGHKENSNKEQQHQRCNMRGNIEGNKDTVRRNVDVNRESKQEMKETQIRLVNNNNDYSHNSHNSHNSNAMSSSTPTISVNNNRIASKNKYRDLICQYLSEEVEENDKYEAYIF